MVIMMELPTLTVEHQPKGLDEKFESIFVVSRIFGLFPLTFSRDALEISRPLFVVSHILVLLPFLSFFFVKQHLVIFDNLLPRNFVFLSYVFPLFCLSTVPAISLYWLPYKVKKLQKIFLALRSVEEEVGHEFEPIRNFYPLMAVGIFIPVFLCERYYFGPLYTKDPCGYFSVYVVVLVVLLASQFTAVLRYVRRTYEHLTATLDMSRAEKWLTCHELLGTSCRRLSASYSPQLLLVITSSFVYVVFQTYFLVRAHKTGSPDLGIYVFVFWICFFSLLTWYIVYSCRSTKLEAKKFDKLLYHMIINDNTKTLLKNKRILLHFKAKRKEEFSAMGFFNFDYPLLCSMVSSATTYIVILVQFS